MTTIDFGRRMTWILIVACAACCTARAARSAPIPIDVRASKLTVRVFKSGLFSPLAHNHEIQAPLAEGAVDTSLLSVDLRIESQAMRVLDPKVSDDERSKVQRAMAGPGVLDVTRFPAIRFHSTAIQPSGPGSWHIEGTLELHGESRPIRFEVTREGGLYRGRATLRQTEFGIKPIRIAGGTVKVKNEVGVEFEIALTAS